jgi:hypothetical protein
MDLHGTLEMARKPFKSQKYNLHNIWAQCAFMNTCVVIQYAHNCGLLI